MFHCFYAKPNVTVFDIGFNIFLEAWPIVFPAKKFSCFINIKKACQKVVVMLADELYSNDFRYNR